MSSPKHQASEYPPRLHNDVYPFIHPKKYKATLHKKVTVITGEDVSLTIPPLIWLVSN